MLGPVYKVVPVGVLSITPRNTGGTDYFDTPLWQCLETKIQMP